MGVAASLFYSSNDIEKQTLLRRCTPSDEQYDEQKERWNALADHLIVDLKERSGHSLRTWLQGSYKFGTQIRPVDRGDEFDIDLGVYFQWTGKPEDGRHSPQTLKSFVQDSLKAYEKGDTEDVRDVCPPKTRCCRISYRNNFHIDVPAYHLHAGQDARTLATSDGWETSDPKAIYVWFRDQFDNSTRDKVRRQIRYFKTWAALKLKLDEGRPSSIMLTVLVAEAATALGIANLGADDEALRDLIVGIVKRLEGSVKVSNPVDQSENLNRLTTEQNTTFVDRLKTFQDVALRANTGTTEFDAADVWQEAFEHMFPMPELPEPLAKSANNPPVAVISPEIKVTAESQTNRSARQFTGVNAIGPIPKDCTITFEVTNADAMPAGSVILWTVRNEGREAELVNDLGHSTKIGRVATETSAYKGTHYMDCVVKVTGRTVAMRRVPVTITGATMPLRNPPRKVHFI
jgi:hypothetical protein